VDTVTLVVTALSSSRVATATVAARETYRGLRERVAARFAGNPSREIVLAEHQKDPEVWRAPLAAALTETGAATDPEVVEAAQQLLDLLDEDGARRGKYSVDVRGAQGVQVGDNNVQTNTFSDPSRW